MWIYTKQNTNFTNDLLAKVVNSTYLIEQAKRFSSTEGDTFSQVDTFFNVPNGRLKLRKEGDKASLIFYDRPDIEGAKLCKFTKSDVTGIQGIEESLTNALGVKGIVRKTRQLFLVGQTRIHVDNVEGLGEFMELEVIKDTNDTFEFAKNLGETLMEQLGVDKEHLISGAYLDLLLENKD